jgi:PAT family beta-lactamase induction signal transducer AmpG
LQLSIDKKLTAFSIGASSGLAFALITSTFTAFLYEQGLSLAAIGWISLRLLPYSLKYFFAPLVDIVTHSIGKGLLKRYKMWMLLMQSIMAITLVEMAALSYLGNYTQIICGLSMIFAFAASFYDIALEAYRIELFRNGGAVVGNSFVVSGFRFGLLFSGAFVLYISSVYGWHGAFLIVAVTTLFCALITLFSPSSLCNEQLAENSSTYKMSVKLSFGKFTYYHYWRPVKKLLSRPNALLVMLLIAFYKVSDSFLDTMMPVFLLEIGFSKQDIALVAKSVAIFAFLLGTAAGAFLLQSVKISIALILCESLAAITNLLFISLSYFGADNFILLWINFFEVFCSAMCNIAIISFMSSLCKRKFALVQFAFLQSISSVMRLLLGAISGKLASSLGWNFFFIFSSMLSIPALICIIILDNSNNSIMDNKKLEVNQYY